MEKVEDICAAAVRRGLAGIAITDHCDLYRGKSYCEGLKRRLFADIRRARDTFGDELAISAGIELGEPHQFLDLAAEITDDPELDFVIGSIHIMRGREDFYYVDYENVDLGAMYRQYYDELFELSECGFCDVIGHINYQIRYMDEKTRSRVDLSVYYPVLTEVLESAAKHGVGIEANTSGFPKGLDDTMPSFDVLGMFRSAGGEIVTSGSDAHTVGRVGERIPYAVGRIHEAGFEKFAFFKGRKPVFYDAS
jgi:histidinol-phosphatase (PHP family)